MIFFTGNKSMNELNLRQLVFITSAYGPFIKYCWKFQTFRETGDLNYIYKNKLDKACVAHDAAYSNGKDLAQKTISDTILKDRSYEIAINPKYDGYQRGLDKKEGKCKRSPYSRIQELHK